jgi:hypothetical protein
MCPKESGQLSRKWQIIGLLHLGLSVLDIDKPLIDVCTVASRARAFFLDAREYSAYLLPKLTHPDRG